MYELCLHYAKTLPPTRLASPQLRLQLRRLHLLKYMYVRVVGIYIYI